ncbi:MAG: hypothetical protein ABI860_12305 [Gemmatimonadales bacterium]
MHPLIRAVLAPALLAGPIALGARSAPPRPSPSPVRPSAAAVANTLGDHYAALELAADSVVAAHSAADAAPSELAQVTARNLALRIRAVSGDYEALSVAMTAANYERGQSLWVRLALAQAGLEMLEEDAARLGGDPATGPAEVRDLADRLSGVLELGRVSGRAASRTFGAPALDASDDAPRNPCAACRRNLPAQT